MKTVDEIIKRYDIVLAGDDALRIRNTTAAKRDNAINELKSRKSEIFARLAEIKAAETKAAEERAAKIAAIEGLDEIKKAKIEIEKWNYEFEKSFEGEYAVGGMGVGKKPDYDLQAMYKKYPAAHAYLRAEAQMFKTNDELPAIGRRALNAIIDAPDNYEAIMAKMDAEIKAFAEKHMFD